MITPHNILRHELVGLKVRVSEASRPEKETSGDVVEETKSTLTVKTCKGDKKIAKENSTFEFELPGKQAVKVKGELLLGRPEERIKKKYRIKFI